MDQSFDAWIVLLSCLTCVVFQVCIYGGPSRRGSAATINRLICRRDDQLWRRCRQVYSLSIRTNDRYNGPPIEIIKANLPGAKTDVYVQRPKPFVPKRPRPHSAVSAPDKYSSHHTHWDLLPHRRDKAYPNWWKHPTVAACMKSFSASTLEDLTCDEVVNNQPTIPNPNFLATMIILRQKLLEWEKAEEKVYQATRGWYVANRDIEKKAWRSWALSQNRDFGAAVWRWLRLDNREKTQTARMKGLYVLLGGRGG
jgi:hypothetical protein